MQLRNCVKHHLIECIVSNVINTLNCGCIFAVQEPRVWNCLSAKLRSPDTLDMFRNKLKTLLFKV